MYAYAYVYLYVCTYIFPKLLDQSKSRTPLSPPHGPCSTPDSSGIGSAAAGLCKGPVSHDSCREPSDLLLSKLEEPQNPEASEEGGAAGGGDQGGTARGRLGGAEVGAIARPLEQHVWQLRTPRFAARKGLAQVHAALWLRCVLPGEPDLGWDSLRTEGPPAHTGPLCRILQSVNY